MVGVFEICSLRGKKVDEKIAKLGGKITNHIGRKLFQPMNLSLKVISHRDHQ